MEALSDVVDELRKVRKSLDDLQQKAASARSSYIEEATGHDSDPLSPHIATIPGPLEPQVDVHGVDQDWLNPEPDKSENAEIWRTYVEEGDKYDAQLLAKWNEGIDVFLLFTGLFSAILSAFLVAAWPTIQPDPAQGQTDALVIISQQLVLLSLGKPMDPSEVYQAPNFQAPVWAVMVNCLWFTSLFISLLTAVLAMLLKEWLSAYKEGIALVTLERAKQRQMRYDGMINWKVPSIVSMLPLAIHVAVFLFLTGLVLLAWPVSITLFMLLTTLLSVGLALYIGSAALPLLFPACPYRSPLGSVLERIPRYVWWKSRTFTERTTDRAADFILRKNMVLQARAVAWMAGSTNPMVKHLALHFLSRWAPSACAREEIAAEVDHAANRALKEYIFAIHPDSLPEAKSLEKISSIATLMIEDYAEHPWSWPPPMGDHQSDLDHHLQQVLMASAMNRSVRLLSDVLWCPRSVLTSQYAVIQDRTHGKGTYLELERSLTWVHATPSDAFYIHAALQYWRFLLEQQPPSPLCLDKYLCLLGHWLDIQTLPCCHQSDTWLPRYAPSNTSWEDSLIDCLSALLTPGRIRITGAHRTIRRALLRCLARNPTIMTFENSNRLLECLVSVTKVSTFPAASDIHQDFRVAMPLIVNRLKTPHRHDFMIPYPTMCAWTVLHWCLEAGSFSAHENQVEHLDQARSTPTDGMAAIVEDVSCDAVDLIKGGALQRLSPLLLLYMRPFCPASITIPWEAFRTARLQRDSLSDLISSTDWKYWMWVMGVRGIPYIMGLQHAVDALKWRSRLEEVVSFLLQEIPWDVEASGILEEYYKATGIRVQAIPSNVEEKEADRRAEETP